MAKPKKVALAYSGGLDTSIIIPWLIETYGCEVVAICGDIGQGSDELTGLEEKARKTGASEVHVVDMREEFVSEYLWRLVRAGGEYEHKYLLGTSIARPLLAKKQVEVALRTGCDALAHGCTGKGNDQVRFELAYQALAPHLRVIAPWREWSLRSREEEIEYAAAHGIPVPATREKPYSVDQNLWHRSAEAGVLEDPWQEPPQDVYALTRSPGAAPDDPAYVEIAFERGVPTALDGAATNPVTLIQTLNRLGGQHGVGRVDMVENRLVGIKVRGVYETPGGTILALAHRDLESITIDRDTQHYVALIAPRYAELVYNGLWFSPLRCAFDAFVDAAQHTVTGAVRVKLFKGTCTAVGRTSPHALYRQDLATFGEDAVYDQQDAGGFIHLWGLPTRVFAQMNPQQIRRGLRHPVR